MESPDGVPPSPQDPGGYLPQAAHHARRVIADVERHRRELDRPSRLVGEDAMAEGRVAVDRVRGALGDLLAALEGGGSDGGGGGEPIQEQPKDA